MKDKASSGTNMYFKLRLCDVGRLQQNWFAKLLSFANQQNDTLLAKTFAIRQAHHKLDYSESFR